MRDRAPFLYSRHRLSGHRPERESPISQIRPVREGKDPGHCWPGVWASRAYRVSTEQPNRGQRHVCGVIRCDTGSELIRLCHQWEQLLPGGTACGTYVPPLLGRVSHFNENLTVALCGSQTRVDGLCAGLVSLSAMTVLGHVSLRSVPGGPVTRVTSSVPFRSQSTRLFFAEWLGDVPVDGPTPLPRPDHYYCLGPCRSKRHGPLFASSRPREGEGSASWGGLPVTHRRLKGAGHLLCRECGLAGC